MRSKQKPVLPEGHGFYWRGDTVYLILRHNGEKHQLCTKLKADEPGLRSKLLDFKFARIAEFDDLTRAKATRGVRISDLFDAYVKSIEKRESTGGEYMTANRTSRQSYKVRSTLNVHLVPAFGNMKPGDLTNKMMEEYSAARLQEPGKNGKKPETPKDRTSRQVSINREIGYLRRSMRLGARNGDVDPAHLARLHFPIDLKAEKLSKRTGTINPETFDKIYVASAPHFRPILTTCLYTGVRSKEIKFIRPEQIDFENEVIHLRVGETKEGDAATVTMNDLVKAELLKWAETTKREHPNTNWFFHYEGRQILSFTKAWRRAVDRSGVRDDLKEFERLLFHDTRRTVVTDLRKDRVDMADIRKQTRHKTDVIFDYDQDHDGALERVKASQNARLKGTSVQATPVVPAVSVRDWRVDLKELKDAFEAKLLPKTIYDAEVAKVMASR